MVFLTARSDEVDRILGLEMGGDDYCAKPFSPRELVARLKAIWRREQLLFEQSAATATVTEAAENANQHVSAFPLAARLLTIYQGKP